MRVERFGIGPLRTNCYLIWNEETKELLIVDPGDYTDSIESFIREELLKPTAILLTHAHYDHILGLNGWRKNYPELPIYISKTEEELLKDPKLNGTASYGEYAVSYTADKYLEDYETIELIGEKITFIHTPGHTAGSGCYYFPERGMLFSGDTLFRCSVGRWDLATGNREALMDSLNRKLIVLPDDTQVFPGHERMTTISDEKKFNPFVGE